MPIYEFKCLDCSNEFELVILPKEEISPICPKCGSKKLRKKISAASIRPKGIPKGKGGFKVPECMNRERKN
ncbi:hypothetical protein JCM13304A_14860 [Desulfothermus okinawensis JCM 13304]